MMAVCFPANVKDLFLNRVVPSSSTGLLSIGLVVFVALGDARSQDGTSSSPLASEVTLSELEDLHRAAAEEYDLSIDQGDDQPLVLQATPVSQWVNPRRSGGQLGHVFMWTHGKEPQAIAAIFSFPWRGVANDRRVVHELHALSDQKLNVKRLGSTAKWNPQAGLTRKPIPGLNARSESLARFKIQVRQIARRFSGYCVDGEEKRWELRVLPSPLAVYSIDRSDGTVGFGAMIGIMGDAGSDLESGVLIEALSYSKEDGQSSTRWLFAPIRMTDMETYLSYGNQLIWESVRGGQDTRFHDAQHIYFRFQDKTVSLR